MLVSKAARRYAKALLDMAIADNNIENTLNDILFVKDTIDNSRELKLFLKSPIVKKEDKKAALHSLFNENVAKSTTDFITLISDKGREDILLEITNAFIDRYNKHVGIISVSVNTARNLNEEQLQNITNILEKTTSKKVVLTTNVNKDLIGGISIQIEDTVYDATVKHKLNLLENQFVESSIN